MDNRAIGEKLAELTELMASFEEAGALDTEPEEKSGRVEVPPELATR